jgi:hypothetical protein
MASREATRFYIKPSAGSFAKLFWFKSNRPNELLLGGYSLNGTPATITHEFPEKRWSPRDPSQMDVHWIEATPVATPIDHFTCHADGRFHAKSRRGKQLYSHHEQGQPLGPSSPVFLDVIIASDVISKYATLNSEPKRPHAWLQTSADMTISLNAVFAGIRYPIVNEVVRTGAGNPGKCAGVVMASAMLQCAVWGRSLPISTEAMNARPPGTLFIFQWKRGNRTMGAKAFVLN